MKNMIDEEVPEHWKTARGTMLNYYRQIVNAQKWRNYLVVTYKDLYEAYDNVHKFKVMLEKRVPYNYNQELRQHLVFKANQKFVNHGQRRLLIRDFMEDHHTMHTIIVAKSVTPLVVLYEEHVPFEQVDEYLTIERNYYYE
jgi:hypothetical protein